MTKSLTGRFDATVTVRQKVAAGMNLRTASEPEARSPPRDPGFGPGSSGAGPGALLPSEAPKQCQSDRNLTASRLPVACLALPVGAAAA